MISTNLKPAQQLRSKSTATTKRVELDRQLLENRLQSSRIAASRVVEPSTALKPSSQQQIPINASKLQPQLIQQQQYQSKYTDNDLNITQFSQLVDSSKRHQLLKLSINQVKPLGFEVRKLRAQYLKQTQEFQLFFLQIKDLLKHKKTRSPSVIKGKIRQQEIQKSDTQIISDLQSQLANCQKGSNCQKELNQKLAAENENLKFNEVVLQQKLLKLTQSLSQSQTQCVGKDATIAELNSQISKSKKEVTKFNEVQKQFFECQKLIKAKDAELQLLKEKNRNQVQDITLEKSLRDQIEQLKKSAKEQENILSQSNQQILDSQTKLKLLEKENKFLTQTLEKMQAVLLQKDALTSEVKESFKTKADQLMKLNQTLEQKEQQESSNQSHLKQLQQQVATFQDKIAAKDFETLKINKQLQDTKLLLEKQINQNKLLTSNLAETKVQLQTKEAELVSVKETQITDSLYLNQQLADQYASNMLFSQNETFQSRKQELDAQILQKSRENEDLIIQLKQQSNQNQLLNLTLYKLKSQLQDKDAEAVRFKLLFEEKLALVSQLETLNNELSNQLNINSKYLQQEISVQKAEFEAQVVDIQSQLFEKEKENLQSIYDFQQYKEKKDYENEKLQKDSKPKSSQIAELEQRNSQLSEQLETFETEIQSLKAKLAAIQAQKEDSSAQTFPSQTQNFGTQTSQSILENEIINLRSTNTKLESEISALKSQLSADHLKDSFASLKQEAELQECAIQLAANASFSQLNALSRAQRRKRTDFEGAAKNVQTEELQSFKAQFGASLQPREKVTEPECREVRTDSVTHQTVQTEASGLIPAIDAETQRERTDVQNAKVSGPLIEKPVSSENCAVQTDFQDTLSAQPEQLAGVQILQLIPPENCEVQTAVSNPTCSIDLEGPLLVTQSQELAVQTVETKATSQILPQNNSIKLLKNGETQTDPPPKPQQLDLPMRHMSSKFHSVNSWVSPATQDVNPFAARQPRGIQATDLKTQTNDLPAVVSEEIQATNIESLSGENLKSPDFGRQIAALELTIEAQNEEIALLKQQDYSQLINSMLKAKENTIRTLEAQVNKNQEEKTISERAKSQTKKNNVQVLQRTIQELNKQLETQDELLDNREQLQRNQTFLYQQIQDLNQDKFRLEQRLTQQKCDLLYYKGIYLQSQEELELLRTQIDELKQNFKNLHKFLKSNKESLSNSAVSPKQAELLQQNIQMLMYSNSRHRQQISTLFKQLNAQQLKYHQQLAHTVEMLNSATEPNIMLLNDQLFNIGDIYLGEDCGITKQILFISTNTTTKNFQNQVLCIGKVTISNPFLLLSMQETMSFEVVAKTLEQQTTSKINLQYCISPTVIYYASSQLFNIKLSDITQVERDNIKRIICSNRLEQVFNTVSGFPPLLQELKSQLFEKLHNKSYDLQSLFLIYPQTLEMQLLGELLLFSKDPNNHCTEKQFVLMQDYMQDLQQDQAIVKLTTLFGEQSLLSFTFQLLHQLGQLSRDLKLFDEFTVLSYASDLSRYLLQESEQMDVRHTTLLLKQIKQIHLRSKVCSFLLT